MCDLKTCTPRARSAVPPLSSLLCDDSVLPFIIDIREHLGADGLFSIAAFVSCDGEVVKSEFL